MSMYEEELYRKALSVWGKEAQMKMVIEECAELIQAILKFGRVSGDITQQQKAWHNLCEEIADVEIVLEQAKLIANPSGAVINMWKQQKLMRLEQRLNDTLRPSGPSTVSESQEETQPV